jgi:HAE1 family hydrophobic/amphiphilic exporter-1
VQRAYWDLAFALKNLEVQQDAVATTKTQLLHTKRLIDEGRLAAVDLIAVQAQLTKCIAQQNSAVATVLRAESELKKSVNADETVWQQTLLPIDNISLPTPTIKLSEALKVATDNRLELYQQKSVKAINDINQQFFREQTKPDIDLTLSYSMNGFAGKPATNNNSTEILSPTTEQLRLFTARTKPSMIAQATLLPPLLTGSYGQSFNNLFQNRFNSFRIGITISFPIRNSSAKAELGKSLVEAEKIAIETRQLVQNIQAEVRNALQDLRVAEAKLKSAESIRLAASQLLESEKRKFEAGHENASVNLILEKQRELSLAQSQELEARIDLNRSINELQRAMGVTLEQHKVVMKYIK